MASSTVEDYLKRIYLGQGRDEERLVPMGELAESMGVTPGTATSMVKSLAASMLVAYTPYAGVRVTENGRKLALSILRRHRVIECFLVETLGMDWADVHEEAERLEHAVSERVLARMYAFLGSPGFDPHGDPIPSLEGNVARRLVEPLSTVEGDRRCRIARITDQSPDFLRAVEQLGLLPGTNVRVGQRNPAAGTVDVAVRPRRTVTVADDVADRILVEPRTKRTTRKKAKPRPMRKARPKRQKRPARPKRRG